MQPVWRLTRLNSQSRECAGSALSSGCPKGVPLTRYSAIALVLLAASPAGAAEKTVERTFTVSPGGSLIVDADSASVHVSGGDTNQVTVRMSARGSEEDLATAKLDAFQKDGGVTVMMRRPGKKSWFNWGSWNGEGNIEVTVPRRYGINIQNIRWKRGAERHRRLRELAYLWR